MPTYNEAGRYLEEVIDHLLPIVDGKLFIYDDRSTDSTFELVSEKGLIGVIREPDVPSFSQHEGGFRQWGWNMFQSLMHPKPGDWVLAIDADEKLYGYEHISTLMQLPFDVLGVSFYHMWNDTHYRVDKAWAPTVSSRLFKYQEHGAYSSRRMACGSEPDYVIRLIHQGKMLKQTPLVMQHLGYQRDDDKKAKYTRYSTLDKGEFHSMAHIESILDPEPTLVPWTLS
jgi:glycosyltransferase involved in cell wall biosynthesis